jgi:hypothetical protein
VFNGWNVRSDQLQDARQHDMVDGALADTANMGRGVACAGPAIEEMVLRALRDQLPPAKRAF